MPFSRMELPRKVFFFTFCLIKLSLAVVQDDVTEKYSSEESTSDSEIMGKFNAQSLGNLIAFSSKRLTRVLEGATHVLHMNVSCNNCSERSVAFFAMSDEKIAQVDPANATLLKIHDDLYSVNANLSGLFLGMTSLKVTIVTDDDVKIVGTHTIFVGRKVTRIDTLFNWLLTSFIILVTITFGCELDLEKLKGYFRRPVGILTGLLCQYGLMPSLAVASSILGKLNAVFSFGLLAYGCSPGGGSSNMWTILLGGDINLSVTMTFTSIFCSFVFMPLWLFTAGKHFSSNNAEIPFVNIVIFLSCLVVPAVVGMGIRYFREGIARTLIKYLRPVSIGCILCLLAIGLYINRFVFVLMARLGFRLVLPCVAIPWGGFLLSLALAVVLRQPWSDAKTIAIEAGIQNITIALVLLRNSLPSPESEISTAPPLIASMLATLPLMVIVVLRKAFFLLREKCHGKADDSCSTQNGDVLKSKDGIDNPSMDAEIAEKSRNSRDDTQQENSKF